MRFQILRLAVAVSLTLSSAMGAAAYEPFQLQLPKASYLPPLPYVPKVFSPAPVVAAAVAPAPVAAARVAVTEYQVQYRHPTQTNNQFRVAVAWTSNYTYARSVYDNLVGHRVYDVRLYKRGGR